MTDMKLRIHNGTRPIIEAVKFITFPSGETMPYLTDPILLAISVSKRVQIVKPINSGNDLLEIAMVVDAIREADKNIKIELLASYIMGARQDRVCDEGQPLSARVIARMLNGLKLHRVATVTPHSDVLPALIDNCESFDITSSLVSEIIEKIDFSNNGNGKVYLVAPDAGATKRTLTALKEIREDFEFVDVEFLQGSKQRDPKTGKLSGFDVAIDKFHHDDVIIVTDDVCGYGGTFVGLANVLQDRGADPSQLHLTVAHADCIEGLRKVAGIYEGGVYTTTQLPEHDGFDRNIFVINIDE